MNTAFLPWQLIPFQNNLCFYIGPLIHTADRSHKEYVQYHRMILRSRTACDGSINVTVIMDLIFTKCIIYFQWCS
jgi:hypothetical protein